MATGKVIFAGKDSGNTTAGTMVPSNKPSYFTHPASIQSDWQDACTAPETADNGGSSVVNPQAITRADQNWVYPQLKGTTLMIRLKYNDDVAATITNPVVQPFGIDGTGVGESAAFPQALTDADGTHELTLTLTIASDVTDGTFKYTPPVEVDIDANTAVLIAIKTAFNTTDGTEADSTIQVRLK
jgi:hypothetical protein